MVAKRWIGGLISGSESSGLLRDQIGHHARKMAIMIGMENQMRSFHTSSGLSSSGFGNFMHQDATPPIITASAATTTTTTTSTEVTTTDPSVVVDESRSDLEIKDPQLIFNRVIKVLEEKFGRKRLYFPKEVCQLHCTLELTLLDLLACRSVSNLFCFDIIRNSPGA